MNKEELLEQELLKQEEKVLNLFNHKMKKPIHDVYGVDFEKLKETEHVCEIHVGSFTLKGLKKQYNLNPNNLNLLLCDDGWSSELDVVRIHSDFTKYTLPERRNIPTFYGKVAFESFRKKDNYIHITLVLSIPMSCVSFDFETILKNETDHKWFSMHNTIQETPCNVRFNCKNDRLYIDGKLIQKYFSESSYNSCANNNIDKSGYSVVSKHIAFSRKVAEIKQNKLKSCFNTKFNKSNAEVFDMLTNARITLADRIKECEDTEGLYELSDKVKQIYYIMTSYEEHIKNLADSNNDNTSNYHKYTSIDQVENKINYLKGRINKVLKVEG